MKRIFISIILISFIFSCKIRSNRHPSPENRDFEALSQKLDFLDLEQDTMSDDQIKGTLITKSLDLESYQIGKNYYPSLIIERSDDSDFAIFKACSYLEECTRGQTTKSAEIIFFKFNESYTVEASSCVYKDSSFDEDKICGLPLKRKGFLSNTNFDTILHDLIEEKEILKEEISTNSTNLMNALDNYELGIELCRKTIPDLVPVIPLDDVDKIKELGVVFFSDYFVESVEKSNKKKTKSDFLQQETSGSTYNILFGIGGTVSGIAMFLSAIDMKELISTEEYNKLSPEQKEKFLNSLSDEIKSEITQGTKVIKTRDGEVTLEDAQKKPQLSSAPNQNKVNSIDAPKKFTRTGKSFMAMGIVSAAAGALMTSLATKDNFNLVETEFDTRCPANEKIIDDLYEIQNKMVIKKDEVRNIDKKICTHNGDC